MSGQENPRDKVSEALIAYSKGEIDELGVADAMEMPLTTDHEKAMAIQSVRNLTDSGYRQRGREPTPVMNPMGITTVHGDGRVQIPKRIRDARRIVDGSYVFWYEAEGMIIISERQINSDAAKVHLSFDSSKTRPK